MKLNKRRTSLHYLGISRWLWTRTPEVIPYQLHGLLVNKTNLMHNLFLVYLSISTCFGDYAPIARRNNLVYATLGTCYPVWITSTKCRINIVVSPDDGHIIARNM